MSKKCRGTIVNGKCVLEKLQKKHRILKELVKELQRKGHTKKLGSYATVRALKLSKEGKKVLNSRFNKTAK